MKKVWMLFIMLNLTWFAQAQHTNIFVKHEAAINGYDAVAYHTMNKAVKGDKKISHEWMGAKWLFSTEENKRAFVANPEKYAPQYGGYCAYGVFKNDLFPTEPDAFAVVNGKLYLNYDTEVQTRWEKEKDKMIPVADKNWKTLAHKKK
ncbi:MAG: YHS domain-containing (seleno)protein [Flammeovirgaceae bacterium]